MRLAPLLAAGRLGCGWSDPASVSRLAGPSPAEIDPAAASVGVDLPSGIGIRPGSARLFLGAEREDTGETTGATARLVPRGGRWRVDPADLPALRRTHATIRRWKAEAPDATEGTLSVAVGGCLDGAEAGPDPRVSVDLVLAPDAAPLPLVRRAPLSVVVANATLPVCAT